MLPYIIVGASCFVAGVLGTIVTIALCRASARASE